MATIENFVLRFKTEGAQGIKTLADGLSSLGTQVGGVGGAFEGLLGKLGPVGIAAGAVGGAFAALGLKAIQLAEQISDVAGATGISEGALATFRRSVIEAGGGADDFAVIASKLNQNVQEAAAGNGKLQEAFRTLGVFVTDAGGRVRSTEAILQDLTQVFQRGQLSSEQYAAAIDLLGKSANRIELGKLQALRDPIEEANIKKLDQYGQAIEKIRFRLESKIVTFFGQLAQDIDNSIERVDAFEKKLNAQGKTLGGFWERVFKGPFAGIRDLTIAEKAALDNAREIQKLQNTKPAPGTPAAPTTGGFGAEPENIKKLRAEIQNLAATYDVAARARLSNVTLQGELVGLSQREREIVIAQQQATNEFLAAQDRLLQKKRELKDEEKQLNAEIDKQLQANAEVYTRTYQNIEAQIRANQEAARTFEAGWNTAMKNYVDNMTNAATRAQNIFNALTRNMESAIDRFVETGKFSFSDFTRSVIADLLKIQLKAATVNLFRQLGGSGGGLFGSIAGLFRANGGNVNAGQPYIVGERGMELFVPRSSGTIVPNNQLAAGGGGTNVVYNISAVDADSFKNLLARDPSFLYAVTEQGRKAIPQTRR